MAHTAAADTMQQSMEAYERRVNILPRERVTLRCKSGHEWATTHARQTASTFAHYDQPWCPVCDEYWVSGQRETDEDTEAQVSALCAANPYA